MFDHRDNCLEVDVLSERPTGFSKYIKMAFENNLKLHQELAKIVGKHFRLSWGSWQMKNEQIKKGLICNFEKALKIADVPICELKKISEMLSRSSV